MSPLTTSLRRWTASGVRRGARTVLLTYPGLGFGNNLYFALRSHVFARRGREHRVELTDAMRPWLKAVPGLGAYFVEREDIGFWDRREHITPSFYQSFGSDFVRTDLEAFVEEVLLPSPLFDRARERASSWADEDVLTVNVRRGDYYAVDAFRRIYGFDLASYVHSAVAEAHRERGRFGRIHVVSDGVGWCRSHLAWLEGYADSVTFVDPGDSPRQNLVDVALSPALVLTNSTFSYWGGYISNTIHRDNHASVWAPRFFGRGLRPEGSSAWQLDPLWRVIGDVAGAAAGGGEH